MQGNIERILVIFVEPMLYGLDLIHEVYEKTLYEFQYVYCHNKLTGKQDLSLPENSCICSGNDINHKRQIIEILGNFNPDFVIINGYIGDEQITAIRYCQKRRIPYAIESDTPLNIPASKMKAIGKKIILRKLLHHPMCYGFPGGSLQKENFLYYGIPEEKNYIMPMSVSEHRLITEKNLLPDQEELKKKFDIMGKTVFLFVGRLAPEKNVEILVDSYIELKKKNQNIALLIVGDGSEGEILKKRITDSHVKDVYFMGYTLFPEIVQYYKMADVFILPSIYEPWGLVVNEAMIMGLPVIVSDKVGCRKDLVVEGENGFIFSNREELITCMAKMLDFNNKISTIKYWNYRKYLKNFEDAVRIICERKNL